MDTTITIFSVILLLGAAHGVFLSLALLHAKGGNPVAHHILALLTMVFALDLGLEFLDQTRYLVRMVKLAIVEPSMNLLYGPLGYLYAVSLTSKIPLELRKKWKHLIPFLVGNLLLIPALTLDEAQLFDLFYGEIEVNNAAVFWVVVSIAFLHLGAIASIGSYLILAFRRLIQHRRSVLDQFSSIEHISLNWLRLLLIVLSVLYIVMLVDMFLSESLGLDETVNNVLYLLVVISIYAMGYMGLRQPLIFTNSNMDAASESKADSKEADVVQGAAKKKYEKSALDKETSAVLLKDLEQYVNTKKPYLDNEITLRDLSGSLGISTNYLSQVINGQLGKNFFDFINGFRVEEAKTRLADPSQTATSIVTIALESGFNSKSAFYTAFKKHTGLTPTEYRSKRIARCNP